MRLEASEEREQEERLACGMSRRLEVRPQDLGIGSLFETVRDAIIVAEAATGRIVLCNPAATEILGYSPEEALA